MKKLAEKIVNTIMDSIERQENPKYRTITECEFYAKDENTLEVWIKSNCDGWAEDIKVITTLHLNDESWFTFVSNDFIGMSEDDANQMIAISSLEGLDFSKYGFFTDMITDEIIDF